MQEIYLRFADLQLLSLQPAAALAQLEKATHTQRQNPCKQRLVERTYPTVGKTARTACVRNSTKLSSTTAKNTQRATKPDVAVEGQGVPTGIIAVT